MTINLKNKISELNSKISHRTKAEIIAVIVFIISIWYVTIPTKPEPGKWEESPPSAKVKNIGKEEIPCTKLVVLKPEAKKKLKLPNPVIDNPAVHVSGSTDIKPGERPITVISTIDTNTGKTTILTRVEPYPWLAVQNRGEIRADIGLKNSGIVVGRFTLREDVIQIKGINVGFNLSADTDASFYLGAGVGYRW